GPVELSEQAEITKDGHACRREGEEIGVHLERGLAERRVWPQVRGRRIGVLEPAPRDLEADAEAADRRSPDRGPRCLVGIARGLVAQRIVARAAWRRMSRRRRWFRGLRRRQLGGGRFLRCRVGRLGRWGRGGGIEPEERSERAAERRNTLGVW